MMQQKLSMLMRRGLNSVCSRLNKQQPNYKTPSFFYTSKSENPDSETQINPPSDLDDVTTHELKTKIDKFYKGDFDSIPDIFESILKRKLSGNHQDSDDELMNEFRKAQPDVNIDDSSYSSASDSDSDSDSD